MSLGRDDVEALAGLPATTQMPEVTLVGVRSPSCGSERALPVGSGQTAEGRWVGRGCDRHSVCTYGEPVPGPPLSAEDVLMSGTDEHPCPLELTCPPLL